jgi:sugar phosphate isomerase/epimerase
MIDRRQFVELTAGFVAATSLRPSDLIASEGRSEIPIALQLYTVREESKKDFLKTIEAVAKMGYQGVELAGYFGHSAKEIRTCLDANGLEVAGTHTGIDTVRAEALAETIELNQILGNRNLIVPWLPEEMRSSRDAWLRTAELFNGLVDRVEPAGMRIGYHNHDMEFVPMNGEMPWDLFATATREEVILQFDTGNAGVRDVDPVPFLKRYPGRTVTIHIKEHSRSNPDALIGEGDIPFAEVVEVCRTTGGTEWFILEEEKNVYPPLECAEKSLERFRQVLAAIDRVPAT